MNPSLTFWYICSRSLLALAIILAASCERADDGTLATGADSGHTDSDAGDGSSGDANTSDSDISQPPAHLAGTYTIANLDFLISSEHVREHAVEYDSVHDAYVITYVNTAGPAGFRLQALGVSTAQAPPLVGAELALDDELAADFWSGQHALAGGEPGTGGLFLVAFRSFRPVVAGEAASNWIYGQFIRTRADGSLERIGANFVISSGSSVEAEPCAAWDETAGTFVVGYSSAREFSSRPDGWILLARTVSADGELGPEIRMADEELGQRGCSAQGGGGLFLLAWHEYFATGGPNFDTGYRARFIENGLPSEVIPALRVGMVIPTAPALAYNTRQGEWMKAYKVERSLRVTIFQPGASPRIFDKLIAEPAEGAGAPNLAYSEKTNSYLLTYHAWDSTDASAQELDPDGTPIVAALGLNVVAPPNGTYATPLAASTATSEYFVVMMKDFTRLNGTLFRAPSQLP
ncbi:MAG: hypothetical protein H0U74_11405 [Bradymonadaceae bacterium]|nr:hypothetical protein [Lujinxingiaceae bacterium]